MQTAANCTQDKQQALQAPSALCVWGHSQPGGAHSPRQALGSLSKSTIDSIRTACTRNNSVHSPRALSAKANSSSIPDSGGHWWPLPEALSSEGLDCTQPLIASGKVWTTCGASRPDTAQRSATPSKSPQVPETISSTMAGVTEGSGLHLLESPRCALESTTSVATSRRPRASLWATAHAPVCEGVAHAGSAAPPQRISSCVPSHSL